MLLIDDCSKALFDGIPGIRYVRDGVPGHSSELQDTENDGQSLFVPPEGRHQSEDEEGKHENCGDQACRFKHFLALSH